MKNRFFNTVLLIFCLILLAGFLVFLHDSASCPPLRVLNAAPSEQDSASESHRSLSEAELLISQYAQDNGLSIEQWPESLVRLLEQNPETQDFVFSYPSEKDLEHSVDLSEYSGAESVPLFMQWDKRWGYITYGSDMAAITGCGPLCLAMAGFYVTGDAQTFTPNNILRFSIENGYCVYGNGSSWTLISEGGEILGLDVTEIPLDEERIIDNLEVDNPIICVMGPGDFTDSGHYIVMVGYEDGMIRINDPNSYARSETLWSFLQIKDQIENLWVIRSLE